MARPISRPWMLGLTLPLCLLVCGCKGTTYHRAVTAQQRWEPPPAQLASDNVRELGASQCPSVASPGTDSYRLCEERLRAQQSELGVGGSGPVEASGPVPWMPGVPEPGCTGPVLASDEEMLRLCGVPTPSR
jgi:hypothetical protein